MNNPAQPSRTPLTTDDLRHAPLPDLLLYGLTLGEEDPTLGVLLGIRHELGLVTHLAECASPRADSALGEVVPVLEGITRRLDVAIELVTRAHQAPTPKPPAEAEEPGAS